MCTHTLHTRVRAHMCTHTHAHSHMHAHARAHTQKHRTVICQAELELDRSRQRGEALISCPSGQRRGMVTTIRNKVSVAKLLPPTYFQGSCLVLAGPAEARSAETKESREVGMEPHATCLLRNVRNLGSEGSQSTPVALRQGDFAPKGHLALSGDILGSHSWG